MSSILKPSRQNGCRTIPITLTGTHLRKAPQDQQRLSPPQKTAFSLVEVVMALGICSFALLALLSLIPVSLNSAQNAVETTRIAKAFQAVTSELTQSKFATVSAMTTREWHFDYDGKPATAAEKHFTVRATTAPSPIANQAAGSLIRINLESQSPDNLHAGSTTITICDMGY